MILTEQQFEQASRRPEVRTMHHALDYLWSQHEEPPYSFKRMVELASIEDAYQLIYEKYWEVVHELVSQAV